MFEYRRPDKDKLEVLERHEGKRKLAIERLTPAFCLLWEFHSSGAYKKRAEMKVLPNGDRVLHGELIYGRDNDTRRDL